MAHDLHDETFIPYYDHMMKLLNINPELDTNVKGSLVGLITMDDFLPLYQVLQNLSGEEKAELVKRVQELVMAITIEALKKYISVPAQRSALFVLLRSAAS